MRRQGGRYGGDSGRGAYGGTAAQMHPHRQQQSDKSGYYRGRHQEQQTVGESEGNQHQNQWRWERDGAQSELPQTAMSPTAPFTEGKSLFQIYIYICCFFHSFDYCFDWDVMRSGREWWSDCSDILSIFMCNWYPSHVSLVSNDFNSMHVCSRYSYRFLFYFYKMLEINLYAFLIWAVSVDWWRD